MPLLPKPDLCRGCPAYGDGKGYVPDLVRNNAPVMVVAQNPGEDEEAGRRYLGHDTYESATHEPLMGRTGRMMDQTFLGLAGLNREDVSLGNTIRCRINHSNELPIKRKDVQEIVRFCTNAHRHLRPEGVKLYVAMGEAATYGLTKILHDFNGWRGYLLPYSPHGTPYTPHTNVWTPGPGDIPVLVTHHLAYLFREPEASLPAKRDWNKVQSILDRTWPVPMSPIETNPEKLRWVPGSAYDTEYVPDTGKLIRFSVANPDRSVFVIEWSDMVRYRGESAKVVHQAIAKKAPPFFMQGVRRLSVSECQEGMVSSVLPTALSPMGSEAVSRAASLPSSSDLSGTAMLRVRPQASSQAGIYKNSRGVRPDLWPIPGYGQIPVWAVPDLSGEATIGPRSQSSNDEAPGVVVQALQYWAGILPRPSRAFDEGDLLPLSIVGPNVVVALPYLAWILPRGPLLTTDCTMYAHACIWSGKTAAEGTKSGGGMAHDLNFLGSLYSKINRWKHLSDLAPRLYSGGDAIGTMDVWDTGLHGGIKGELARDPKSAWVYENLQKPLIPIIMRAMATGIATNPEAVKVALQDITMTQTGYVHQAQAYAGWPINLRSPKQLAYWLYTVEGLRVRRGKR